MIHGTPRDANSLSPVPSAARPRAPPAVCCSLHRSMMAGASVAVTDGDERRIGHAAARMKVTCVTPLGDDTVSIL